jgi:hypothetical protein
MTAGSSDPAFVYGIAWTRDEVKEPVDPNDVQWFDTSGEAAYEFNRRDDKYWPSALVRAPLGAVEVYQYGESPFGVAK